MTQRSKFTERAQAYLRSQGDLAFRLRWEGVGTVPEDAYPLRALVIVETQGRGGNRDADNLLKAVMDALQRARVIPNDNLTRVKQLEVVVEPTGRNHVTVALTPPRPVVIPGDRLQVPEAVLVPVMLPSQGTVPERRVIGKRRQAGREASAPLVPPS